MSRSKGSGTCPFKNTSLNMNKKKRKKIIIANQLFLFIEMLYREREKKYKSYAESNNGRKIRNESNFTFLENGHDSMGPL